MPSSEKNNDSIPGLHSVLNRDEAEKIYSQGSEQTIFVLLELSAEVQRLRGNDPVSGTPSAPPSATPVHKKPTTPAGKKKRTKRGAKRGHPGASRPAPEQIDRREEHHLEQCPDCGGPVTPRRGKSATRTRLIEDIPEQLTSEVTEHTLHCAYCPTCKKTVEPKVADALPGSRLGHRALALSTWFHYGLGITLSHIREVLDAHLHFSISQGQLINWGHRLTEVLTPWYNEIGEAVKSSGTINADETGWRVTGKTHWLWCFSGSDATYYLIDRSRGSPALTKFFTEAVDGILVTDFWQAYNRVECGGRQKCLPHLFREIDATSDKDASESWRRFAKKLGRLLRDGLRLKKAGDISTETYERRSQRIKNRLKSLVKKSVLEENANADPNANVVRLCKRLRRHEDEIFTFLDHENVPADNNAGEREIRPAVIIRKNSNGNQSDRGASTQAVLMTVYRTLKKRGLNPLDEIVAALRHYCIHGQLPPLPNKNPATD